MSLRASDGGEAPAALERLRDVAGRAAEHASVVLWAAAGEAVDLSGLQR